MRTNSNLEENELIRLCGKEDEEAWNEFLNRYGEYIWNFAKYNSRTVESDKFCLYVLEKLKVENRLAKFDPSKAKFITWFNKVLKNLLIDLARKESRESVELIFFGEVPEPLDVRDPAITLELEEKLRITRWLFEDLPPKYRVTLKLRLLDELGVDEEDILWIAGESKQSNREVLDKIEKVKEKLHKQREKLQLKDERLTRVWTNISKSESDVTILKKEIESLGIDKEEGTEKLRIKYLELQQHLRKLYQQREKLLGGEKKDKFMVNVLTKDIAFILNCPEDTVSSRLRRARQIIANRFAKVRE